MLLNCGVWRRLLRVPWTAGRSNQSILKEINLNVHSLEGLILRLKFLNFGQLMWRVNYFGKTLMLGKNEGKRRKGQQEMWWLDGIMCLSKLLETMKDREIWHASVHGVTKSWKQLCSQTISWRCAKTFGTVSIPKLRISVSKKFMLIGSQTLMCSFKRVQMHIVLWKCKHKPHWPPKPSDLEVSLGRESQELVSR